ncbi:P protein [Eumeta japonica]|uniref:P protein n=1 Tax=Eumeta variegata TaxID=151549 RepID=A0A4C1VYM8_EUMVA|nr:P protein [Eumeta japonica]
MNSQKLSRAPDGRKTAKPNQHQPKQPLLLATTWMVIIFKLHHRKLESETPSEGDKTIFTRKTTELETIGEVDSSDLRPHDEPPAPGERLINGPINEETEQASAKRKRISRLLSSVKLAFLVACWLLLTVALLLNRETGDLVLHTAVQAGSAKGYGELADTKATENVPQVCQADLSCLIGTSLPPAIYTRAIQRSGQGIDKVDWTVPTKRRLRRKRFRAWCVEGLVAEEANRRPIRRVACLGQHARQSVRGVIITSAKKVSSTYWDVPLQPDSVIDFSRSEVVTKILKLPNDEKFMGTRKGGLNRTISNYTEVEDAGNVTEHNSRSDIDKGASVDEREGLQAVRDVSNATFHRDVRNVAEHIATTYVPDKVVAMSTNGDTIRDSQVEEIASRNQSKRQASDKSDGADSDINSTDTELREDFLEDDASKGNLDLRVTIKDTSNENVTNNSLIRNIEKETLKLHMDTTSNATVPVTLTYKVNPLEEDGVIYATILLCFLYVLIIFEVVNRTVAALLSSSLGIAVLALGGSRPSLGELVSWLDVETLLLLFSMMLLVAILAETGLFDYLAVVAFELTGGRTWPLINCLCLFTAVFSTFLDNVTTVLLMTPVTIRLCEVMQLNPVPVLMAMVVFSNVGGAATPVGDPPNVIIASHPVVVAEGINFVTFTVHMGLGVLLVAVQTYLQLRFMFRDIRKLRHNVPHDIQELRQEMAVWRRAAASLSSYSRDEDIVRKALEKKVEKLQKALVRREAGGGSKTDPKFCSTLAQMKQKYRIRDKQLLIKSTICVTFVVVVFFLHCIPELQRLSLGWTALLGALLLLLLADHDDLEPILARVEWSTLLFFAALFVLMEPKAASIRVAQNWFNRFHSGNFDVKDEPRSGRPVTDKVDAISEKNKVGILGLMTIAEDLAIDHKTVLTHLKKAGRTKKLDARVSHELTERRLMNCVLICDSLLKCNETEPSLKIFIPA